MRYVGASYIYMVWIYFVRLYIAHVGLELHAKGVTEPVYLPSFADLLVVDCTRSTGVYSLGKGLEIVANYCVFRYPIRQKQAVPQRISPWQGNELGKPSLLYGWLSFKPHTIRIAHKHYTWTLDLMRMLLFRPHRNKLHQNR